MGTYSRVYMMQVTPTIPHSVIASNFERLSNEALASERPDLIACRELKILMHEAGILGGRNYVPDVAVLDDKDLQSDASSTATCRLAVEVVSPSVFRPIVNGSKPKIDIKIDGYLALPSCDAVLTVAQGEVSVVLMVRTEDGWTRNEYSSREDVVDIAAFGLRCAVSDIYARTPALAHRFRAGRNDMNRRSGSRLRDPSRLAVATVTDAREGRLDIA